MHPKLRAFLVANGLRADATEQQAWEYYKQIQAGGISYVGPERAEVPAQNGAQGESGSDGAQGADQARQAALDGQQPDPEAIAAATRQALADERQRVAEIEDICAHAGMDAQAIRQLVLTGATVDAARKAVLDHLRSSNQPFGAGAGQAQVGVEARDKFRSAALDGMLLRCGHRLEKPADGAREFRGMSLIDIVRECLEQAGVSTRGMDPRAISSRAMASLSSSDFPSLLGAFVNKTLLAAYTEAPATWRPLVAVSSATDFKAKHAVKLSSAPDLLPLNENGEYVHADLKDSKESYQVTTVGRVIRLTRQMIINDDLSGFNRVAQMFGAAAKRFENRTVYGLITGNANMSDGYPLFNAKHNNIVAGAALGTESLKAARTAMRTKKGIHGEALDVQPAFLLIPAALETDAEVLLRSTALPTGTFSSGVFNPWAGKLTPIADPLIDAIKSDCWYLFASPSQYPVIEVAWLMGDEQPFIDEEIDFNTDALGIKVRHDFGAGVVDYVGALYNPGV
ncbi:MAG: Mu-like prophage major head subunit gpT family protein [Desulfobulbus sp.]|nr:Mu-like prophage major head subunit gpT family protein [Desulfobulbus sp.]